MKKSIIITFLFALTLQLCSQGWVPQRSKYQYRDSVRFESDVNFVQPARFQNSFKVGAVTITSNGTELNILDGALVNATELNYLVGVTSGIQAQINAKANSNNTNLTGTVTLPSTTSIGLVSAAELGWLDDVTSSIQTQLNGKAASGHNHSGTYEPVLGNPGVTGYVLSSTTGGVRSWVANGGGGGSMTYPSGDGIPIVVSGSSWGTTLTDNSAHWNTAYGWGNHASAGYLTSQTSHADVVVDGDFGSQGIMLRGASSGTYSILSDNSANWNTAFSWGNHAAAGYSTVSHADVMVDGDFGSQGIMLRGASPGTYSILTNNSSNWNTAYGWGQGLKLDQTSPQTVTGGKPIFNLGATFNGATSEFTTLNATGVSHALVINRTDAGNVHLSFTNPSTGTALTDGTDIGIETDGTLRIRQQENLPMEFYTNNTHKWTILGNGNLVSLTDGTGAFNITTAGTISTPAITFGGVSITATGTELNYTDGVTSSIQAQLDDTIDIANVFLLKHIAINAQTASYTLVLTDDGKMVTMSVGSANNLTVPPNSSVAFPTGTQITIVSIGTGQTTIVAGSGVTINSAGAALKLRVQYSSCTLIKTATNTWLCIGDITT